MKRANDGTVVAALIDALLLWRCPACGGSRRYTGYSVDNPNGQPCRKCAGSGLHPVARGAIEAATGEKYRPPGT